MSKDSVGKCPRCGGEMKDGRYLFLWGGVCSRIRHILADDGIQAYCSKCGFIVSKYLQPEARPWVKFSNKV